METKVSAILLAAGRSERMGAPKPLLPLQGRPAVVRCLESLRDSGIAEIVLVVNPEGGDIVIAAKDIPARVAVNELPGSDMAASVRAGLAVVDRDATGVLICLCDHPLVRPETIEAMVSLHARHPDAIIIPAYRGRKGHPTLFPRLILEDLGTHRHASRCHQPSPREDCRCWTSKTMASSWTWTPRRTIEKSSRDTAPERFAPSRRIWAGALCPEKTRGKRWSNRHPDPQSVNS